MSLLWRLPTACATHRCPLFPDEIEVLRLTFDIRAVREHLKASVMTVLQSLPFRRTAPLLLPMSLPLALPMSITIEPTFQLSFPQGKNI